MKRINIVFLAFVALFFSACATNQKMYDYSGMLSANPKSVLVLMPTNETTENLASAAVASSIVAPLSEAGYYVFPITLVNDLFKHNGISEPSEIANVSTAKLKEIFNADSALYINVSEYGTTYKLINSVTIVRVQAKLVDLSTSNVIWEGSGEAVQDSGSNSGGLIGALVSAVISQIANTVSDASYDLSQVAGANLLMLDCNTCILRGPRSPAYRQDRQITK